jgi:hypothetical protein
LAPNRVSLDDLGAAGASALLFPDKFQGKTLDIVGDELSGDEMAEQLGHLRKETFVYKVSWVWRLMMMYFAAGVYEQGVEFPEKHGGGNGDSTVFARMAADFPDAFQRKIVMNYERFCKRYQLVERALPPASQGASSVLVALAIVGGAVAAAVALLPETFVNEMKRRWAFYGEISLPCGFHRESCQFAFAVPVELAARQPEAVTSRRRTLSDTFSNSTGLVLLVVAGLFLRLVNAVRK